MALPDPLKMYRQAITKFENGVNALAARNVDSKELGQVINQLSKVSLGLQHLSETSLEQLYKRMDLPRRSEIAALAAAVQRVEDKLDHLLPAPMNPAIAPRPPRTRRPALEVAPAAPDTRKAALRPAAKRSPKAGGKP
ncbi:hypothetical protein PS862_04499 [Pseudomonas fluorescens]|uniref:Uncharacterized protein n=1 Tax=Pseudomonas fluorescens TaxID=294 RepID=A0A5E6U979_PSEFL|nr:hypothetical protein [Pseudomonas fluorescens]VVM96708.1 hypothetical protein PS639_03067 [Pseudomonas fluorescens]VVP33542.1 hypothetical protein PS862_04499 [Pseudomonas fluorescens]